LRQAGADAGKVRAGRPATWAGRKPAAAAGRRTPGA